MEEEQYITIGQFWPDDSTIITAISSTPSTASYYIDSISVIPSKKGRNYTETTCGDQNIILQASVDSLDFEWYEANDINNRIGVGSFIIVQPDTTTTYYARYFCSNITDTIKVNVLENKIEAIPDTIFAIQNQEYNINVSGGENYLWSPLDGLSCSDCGSPVVTAIESKKYYVIGTKDNCVGMDSVIVILRPNTYFLPNSFSPDGDGINDFYNLQIETSTEYTLSIYDRFGKSIFETNDMAVDWDGTYNGTDVENWSLCI